MVQPKRTDYDTIFNPVKINGTIIKPDLETLGVLRLKMSTMTYSEFLKPKLLERDMTLVGGKNEPEFPFSLHFKLSQK